MAKFKTAKFKKEFLLEIEQGEEPEGVEVISDGDYVSEGKYERREIVFSFQDKRYMLTSSRSGSYHTDYYYLSENWGDEHECYEVQPVEKTITTWGMIKENG